MSALLSHLQTVLHTPLPPCYQIYWDALRWSDLCFVTASNLRWSPASLNPCSNHQNPNPVIDSSQVLWETSRFSVLHSHSLEQVISHLLNHTWDTDHFRFGGTDNTKMGRTRRTSILKCFPKWFWYLYPSENIVLEFQTQVRNKFGFIKRKWPANH